MKFRTDFVTNSSSSSFISYNIKNKKLYDYVESLGIKIKSSDDGVLESDMKLVLPSGLIGKLDDSGEISYSWVSSSSNSISGIIMETIEQSILSDYPEPDNQPEDWTEYEDEMIEKYREELGELLPSYYAVSSMDGDIEYAWIENEVGFEGEYNCSEVIEVKDGTRTVKIPTESLSTGEELKKGSNLGCGFNISPGKMLTQKWENGRWVTISRVGE